MSTTKEITKVDSSTRFDSVFVNDQDTIKQVSKEDFRQNGNIAKETDMAQAKSDIQTLYKAVGSPLVANTVAEMTNSNKIYVYNGTESGYIKGNWYYYNGTAWVSGGTYNSNNGLNIPTGGTAGQVLAKNSATNYDTAWIDVSGGNSDLFVLSGVYGNGAWTLSHTFREVYNATQTGKNVIGIFTSGDKTNIICRLSYRSMDHLIFKPDFTIEARYQPGYDYVLNDASYFYKSDNTLSVSGSDVPIPAVPEIFFGLKLYCDGSSEYQDNPSGTFTVVDPASMFNDMGQFRDQRPDSFMLIYGNSDSSEYGYYEMYHLHDITVSAGSTEGEGSDNIMVAFQTISMHSGSPILKRVTISGEMYTWEGLDEATITYTATPLTSQA